MNTYGTVNGIIILRELTRSNEATFLKLNSSWRIRHFSSSRFSLSISSSFVRLGLNPIALVISQMNVSTSQFSLCLCKMENGRGIRFKIMNSKYKRQKAFFFTYRNYVTSMYVIVMGFGYEWRKKKIRKGWCEKSFYTWLNEEEKKTFFEKTRGESCWSSSLRKSYNKKQWRGMKKEEKNADIAKIYSSNMK